MKQKYIKIYKKSAIEIQNNKVSKELSLLSAKIDNIKTQKSIPLNI